MSVIEIVSWKTKPGVADKEIEAALVAMVPDLNALPGFLYQSAGKGSQGRWVDVYYWDSVKDAHASNELIADKASLATLLALVELDTICMEVIEPVQASSDTVTLGEGGR
ncbi:MAG: hypothetical protein L3J89_14435 [Gammaproteobacteria bacterium]|nr:hypothetical protein [Gammaproteobacteria bacterium]